MVDDEPDLLKIIFFRLKSQYEVFTAKDGKEALNLAKQVKPDLILLDLRMPVMSGYEVCAAIKSEESIKDTPIIFLTASVVFDVAEKVREHKVSDYLVKPFEMKELLEKIKKYIG